MALTAFYNCEYFSKRPGTGNFFIYKCSYWEIVTQKVLSQSVVISSIGKRCPFFKEKTNLKRNIENKKKESNDNGLDIMC